MAMNLKEAAMMDRYIKATLAARKALEPHESWRREELRAQALVAIREACGATPGMDRIYDDAASLIERTQRNG